MTRRIKPWLLIGLLLMWGGLLVLRALTSDEPRRLPLTHRSGQALAPAESVLHTPAKAVGRPERAIRLQQAKNIFAPLSPRLSESTPGAVRVREAAQRSRQGKTAEARSTEAPTDSATAPAPAGQVRTAQYARQRMAQYRFIGYWMQNGEPRAFLGKGTELYIVRAGETLEGRILVASIGTTTLRLRDPANELESALPLSQEIGSVTSGEQP
jgi:hypothetical protein